MPEVPSNIDAQWKGMNVQVAQSLLLKVSISLRLMPPQKCLVQLMPRIQSFAAPHPPSLPPTTPKASASWTDSHPTSILPVVPTSENVAQCLQARHHRASGRIPIVCLLRADSPTSYRSETVPSRREAPSNPHVHWRTSLPRETCLCRHFSSRRSHRAAATSTLATTRSVHLGGRREVHGSVSRKIGSFLQRARRATVAPFRL